ncbi:MAG: amidophosphoribosyltransferase [Spirochaetes bacterium GWD1_61_31]|nr:MAG: amidophosphoribosyltransferase [Spirochaetes bacterium GWB1_60_80]OHD29761.1 MAG: amidophosphoribosyltransferase [Spirochaetes bacterium GWC1_61_12]OHD42930.1 MAG: amidophosphoribosyltransferase [Spirochaetes bacterium GWE1_60_18]OHD43475.1 MAG: amidophosphoribosyltransferase [Spirochaetes bacterium GWD1_61_31]OHD59564.1 MAG: amidophosphoribosyltransferase [Spirochaetes bacterium GWF1_60_12]HBO40223.1 amidophosphoribosyltransferase [Spirochaetaceae bacterium]
MNTEGNESGPALKHHCGLAAVRAATPVDVQQKLFYMLFAQQHRGQEACGIAWRHGNGLRFDKRLGMVSGAAESWLAGKAESTAGIGHVRYATHGGGGIANAQPVVVDCNKGSIALAHNGNISNSDRLRTALFEGGSIFQTTSDSEILLHRISRSTAAGKEAIIRDALSEVEGAYSLCVLWDNDLIVIRDPMGFRPLYIAQHEGAWYAASETCGLRALGPLDCREVQPGECIVIDDAGLRSFFLPAASRRARCIFELFYFARPDSTIFGQSVYLARQSLGAALAEQDNAAGFKPDLVMPVPDSGTLAALGYAAVAGVPFALGLTRNHYAGRSFIMPTKTERELAVRMKLHAVPEVVAGKDIAIIDDSLVRGTTSGIIVRLLKEAGARSVHVRLSSPELRWPCYYGIDIPTREELISNRMNPEQVAAFIAANSVCFLPLETMRRCLKAPENEFCCACFDGHYPTPLGVCRALEREE